MRMYKNTRLFSMMLCWVRSPLITCIVSIGDNSTMDKNNYFPEEMEKILVVNVIIVIIVACIQR